MNDQDSATVFLVKLRPVGDRPTRASIGKLLKELGRHYGLSCEDAIEVPRDARAVDFTTATSRTRTTNDSTVERPSLSPDRSSEESPATAAAAGQPAVTQRRAVRRKPVLPKPTKPSHEAANRPLPAVPLSLFPAVGTIKEEPRA